MCKEKFIFTIAGLLNLSGLALGLFVSPWWFLLTAFVGVNMFQAGLTGFCPLTKMLNAAKVPACAKASPTM